MKKTKIITAVLLVVFLLISMVGCGEKNNNTNKPAKVRNVTFDFVSLEEVDGKHEITIKWTNNTKENLTFDGSGYLYKKDSSGYGHIGSVSNDKGLTSLNPGESIEAKYSPTDCKLEAGNTYRIGAQANYAKNGQPNTDTVYAKFEVK